MFRFLWGGLVSITGKPMKDYSMLADPPYKVMLTLSAKQLLSEWLSSSMTVVPGWMPQHGLKGSTCERRPVRRRRGNPSF